MATTKRKVAVFTFCSLSGHLRQPDGIRQSCRMSSATPRIVIGVKRRGRNQKAAPRNFSFAVVFAAQFTAQSEPLAHSDRLYAVNQPFSWLLEWSLRPEKPTPVERRRADPASAAFTYT